MHLWLFFQGGFRLLLMEVCWFTMLVCQILVNIGALPSTQWQGATGHQIMWFTCKYCNPQRVNIYSCFHTVFIYTVYWFYIICTVLWNNHKIIFAFSLSFFLIYHSHRSLSILARCWVWGLTEPDCTIIQ